MALPIATLDISCACHARIFGLIARYAGFQVEQLWRTIAYVIDIRYGECCYVSRNVQATTLSDKVTSRISRHCRNARFPFTGEILWRGTRPMKVKRLNHSSAPGSINACCWDDVCCGGLPEHDGLALPGLCNDFVITVRLYQLLM